MKISDLYVLPLPRNDLILRKKINGYLDGITLDGSSDDVLEIVSEIHRHSYGYWLSKKQAKKEEHYKKAIEYFSRLFIRVPAKYVADFYLTDSDYWGCDVYEALICINDSFIVERKIGYQKLKKRGEINYELVPARRLYSNLVNLLAFLFKTFTTPRQAFEVYQKLDNAKRYYIFLPLSLQFDLTTKINAYVQVNDIVLFFVIPPYVIEDPRNAVFVM